MHAIIEMRLPSETKWRILGSFSADSDEEMLEMKALLEGRDPIEALDTLPRGLIWDVIDVIRSDGNKARVSFPSEH